MVEYRHSVSTERLRSYGTALVWYGDRMVRRSYGAAFNAEVSSYSLANLLSPSHYILTLRATMVITDRIRSQYFAGDNAESFIRIEQPNKPVKPKRNGLPWSADEHDRFLGALERFPSGPWKIIASYVGTRTTRQTMTHAQKYREKIARHKRASRESDAGNGQQSLTHGPLMRSPASPGTFPDARWHEPALLPPLQHQFARSASYVAPVYDGSVAEAAARSAPLALLFSDVGSETHQHQHHDEYQYHHYQHLYHQHHSALDALLTSHEPIEIADNTWHQTLERTMRDEATAAHCEPHGHEVAANQMAYSIWI